MFPRTQISQRARQLAAFELGESSPLHSESAETLLDIRDDRFLGLYGDVGLRRAFDHLGLGRMLEERGFSAFELRVHQEEERHILRVFAHRFQKREKSAWLVNRIGNRPRSELADASPDSPQTGEWLLVELALERRRVTLSDSDVANVLGLDWCLLQNPQRHFSKSRLRLPGQRHPGLGVLKAAIEIAALVAQRLGSDFLGLTPDHFHNAVIYSAFAKPLLTDEWLFFAELKKRLMTRYGLSLVEAAWAMEWNLVVGQTHQPIKWKPGVWLCPVQAKRIRGWGRQWAKLPQGPVPKIWLLEGAFKERWAREVHALASEPHDQSGP